MKKLLFILILIDLCHILFSKPYSLFYFFRNITAYIYYGIGGSFWWGTDLDFDVPDIGPITFGTPQLYAGPEAYVFMFPEYGGEFGALAGVSGQFLLPIESWSFNLFDTLIQPAFAVNANIDYWITSYYYGASNLDFSIQPNIVFITKPDKPEEPRYYGWTWPYPLIIAFGMYR